MKLNKLLKKTLLAGILLFSSNGVAKENITWLQVNFEPLFSIQNNKADLTKGYIGKANKLIADSLTQYNHNYKVMPNYGKLIHTIANSKDKIYCTASLLKKPARQKIVGYTDFPVVTHIPNGFITTTSNMKKISKYLASDGSISFDNIDKIKEFKILLLNGRSYFPKTDFEVNILKKNSNVRTISNKNGFTSIMKMIDNNRGGATFSYVSELKSFLAKNKMKNDYKYIPISNMRNILAPSFISCSKTPKGAMVLKDINSYLGTDGYDKIQDYYKQWVPKNIHNFQDELHEKVRLKYEIN